MANNSKKWTIFAAFLARDAWFSGVLVHIGAALALCFTLEIGAGGTNILHIVDIQIENILK